MGRANDREDDRTFVDNALGAENCTWTGDRGRLQHGDECLVRETSLIGPAISYTYLPFT